ncbi:winged helix DNA-binding domain-containing protein [Alloalcanivorax gelatiniphagus]
MTTLTERALNRALLHRQGLLQRSAADPEQLLDRLVGMQAQAPLAPYVAMWSRLTDFDPGRLSTLVSTRRVARTWLMRGTVHLVTAGDARALAPVFAPVLRRTYHSSFPTARDIPADEVVAEGAAMLAEAPRTRAELGRRLRERWPEHDPGAMAYAVTYSLPLVHVPPRGLWGTTGPVSLALLDDWVPATTAPLGDRSPVTALERVVERYLAAFGPASTADVQAWSGLSGLAEVVDGMRAELRDMRSEAGERLWDVPAGHVPDGDVPAPVRFLAEYDNVLLAHRRRARINPLGRRVPLPPGNGARAGTVLVDGTYQADWSLDARGPDLATLTVRAFGNVPAARQVELEEEGHRLLGLVAPGPGARQVKLVDGE